MEISTYYISEIISLNNLWSAKIAIIMILSNLISIGIGRYAIKIRGLGPSINILGLEGLGLPELLATTSLGHIIGAGTILGLKSIHYLP
uniref:Photosystem I reaction center subunit PsaK n=1 Tax=Pleurostichidium falkenbergii TaxID=121064 RepID=A0A4D6UW05_9FLOR|nr:photosystem I reaction center subunit X [Pleurostichidium falkenbergii]QCH39617.1 photosystem I reaction center subunit X [Pleurostichidium falkenbergii]